MQLFSFLGISIDALTIKDLHTIIKNAVDNNEQCIIAHHNLHSLYIYHQQDKMRKFYRQTSFVHIDGMSIVMLGRLLGYPLKREYRVTYVDWIRPLMSESSKQNWRVFFLGSEPGVAMKAASILKKEINGLRLEAMHGYFDASKESEDNRTVIQTINNYRPDILMVGMGMPRQEYWILDNASDINANVILTSGACMDYIAKTIATPPRWIGKLGFEWLYRLFSEPTRLWRRYLVEPWLILKIVIKEIYKNFKSNF